VAKARRVPGIEPDSRFRDAAASAVAVRTEEVFDHSNGVLDTEDVERVHDMRVATRRLRAGMEIFAPCFPKDEYKRALKEVKGLADALGARRDPDVAIQELEEIEKGMGAAEWPGVSSLVAEMRREQREGNSTLGAALDRVEASGLRERLLALAEEARTP
jgi:CHAD domain-containing protein